MAHDGAGLRLDDQCNLVHVDRHGNETYLGRPSEDHYQVLPVEHWDELDRLIKMRLDAEAYRPGCDYAALHAWERGQR